MLSTSCLKRAGCEHHNRSSAEEEIQLQCGAFCKEKQARKALFKLLLTFLKSCTSRTSSLPFPILKISMRWLGSISIILSVSTPSNTALYWWSYTCNRRRHIQPYNTNSKQYSQCDSAFITGWCQRIVKVSVKSKSKHKDKHSCSFINSVLDLGTACSDFWTAAHISGSTSDYFSNSKEFWL